MKLWVDCNCRYQRVVYAEAGKDVVDCFFSLLTLPLSTVLKLFSEDKDSMVSKVGCVANLYQSVEKLDDKYVCHDDAKDELLRPMGGGQSGKLLMLTDGSSSYNSRSYPNRGGFVEGIVTYMVMDDLNVTPMSTTAIKSLGIKDMRALHEKTVQLGYEEGVQILKASFESKTVLTDVFLRKTSRRT